jgi:hypothetical protein
MAHVWPRSPAHPTESQNAQAKVSAHAEATLYPQNPPRRIQRLGLRLTGFESSAYMNPSPDSTSR